MTQTCLSARPSFCTRPISARKDSWTIGCQDRILSHFSSSPELCTLKLNPFITTPHSLSFLLLLPNLPLRAVFFPSIHTEIYLLTLQLPGQNEKRFIFSPSWDSFVAQNLLKLEAAHSKMQEFEQVCLKSTTHEQGASADMERTHTQGDCGNVLPSRDVAKNSGMDHRNQTKTREGY